MIDEVMKKNGGKFPGAQAFIKQLSAMKFDTVRGPVSFDDMRNPVQNIYIKKVEKQEDVRLRQGRALEHGDQDLSERQPVLDRYDKEAFLKQPVYGRDFPPCKILRLARP